MSRPMIEEKTLSDMCAGLRRRGGRWRRLVGDDLRTPGDAQPSAPTPGQRVAPVTELQQFSVSSLAPSPPGSLRSRPRLGRLDMRLGRWRFPEARQLDPVLAPGNP